MNKISLTASMRSNLLSLQNISRQVDSTQNKLSTGNKVNSAIDNPSSYYAARSLNNRAGDLDALLDSMGQAVSTIKAATTALETGASFLEQAAAIANQALEKTQPVAAYVSTEAELLAAIDSGKEGVIVLEKDITMSTNQNIKLKDGQSLAGARYANPSKPQTKLNFNFAGKIDNIIDVGNNSMVSDLEINVISDRCSHFSHAVLNSSDKNNVRYHNLDVNMDFDSAPNSGYIGIRGTDIKFTGNINVKYTGTNGLERDIRGIYGTSTYIYKDNAKMELDNAVFNISGFSYTFCNANLSLKGNSEFNSSSKDLGIIYSTVFIDNSSIINIKTIGSGIFGSELNILSAGTQINLDSPIPFSTNTNFVKENTINAVAGSVIKMPSGTYTAAEDTSFSGSLIKELPSPAFSKNSDKVEEDSRYKSVMDDFSAYMEACKSKRTSAKQTDDSYSEILSQYDSLIKDASYKGVNLLQSQDLKVTFNESRTSSLNVAGKDASSAALGLTTTEWKTQSDVVTAVKELTDALNQIRSMSSEFGSYYNIVTTRQDFTENLINILEEGADKLTLADMNEESANMLALQTRQQLAVNSLSLASQAAQSILKLF